MESVTINNTPVRGKDGWDRADIIGKLLIPVVIALATGYLTWASQQAATREKRLEVAISVLQSTSGSPQVREWALGEASADLGFSTAVETVLKTEPLPTAGSPSSGQGPAQTHQPTNQAIQVGIWAGPLSTFRDKFAETIDLGYKVQEQWPTLLRDNRENLLSSIKRFKDMLEGSFNTLAQLHSEYAAYATVRDALSYPDEKSTLAATDAFYDAISSLPIPLQPDYETKVVGSSGRLRLQLRQMQEWHSALQHTINQNLDTLTKSAK
jgi:hypothetical protein